MNHEGLKRVDPQRLSQIPRRAASVYCVPRAVSQNRLHRRAACGCVDAPLGTRPRSALKYSLRIARRRDLLVLRDPAPTPLWCVRFIDRKDTSVL